MPTHTTLLTEEFVQERATAIGMYNFIRYLGMGTGPLVGGFLLFNQNYFWIFFLGAITFLLIILYAMKMLHFHALQKQNRAPKGRLYFKLFDPQRYEYQYVSFAS